MSPTKSFSTKISNEGPKKLLALDGGGILGTISIEFLIQIEKQLRDSAGGGRADFVLADYFDYVAGTSTGAIIATCVALGMPATEIRSFYHQHGKEMFDRASVFRRYRYKYNDKKLADMLKETIDHCTGETETQLGSMKLRTLLMVVLRNATTDSPWPVSNNPAAKYNDRKRPDCNLDLPLWQLVRASTAAPTYFPPEVVKIGPKTFIFVDGGVTVFNNPAFQLFQMATSNAYKLQWPTGVAQMLLVSIGTGSAPDANPYLQSEDLNLVYNATRIPSALMAAANAQQDFLCRSFGRCLHGGEIDREVGDLVFPTSGGPETDVKRLFTYIRYNVDMSQEGLNNLGLGIIDAADVASMDSVSYIRELAEIGKRAAARDVQASHFAGFNPK